MPVYSYWCHFHGGFDMIQPLGELSALCPKCKRTAQKVMTSPARITVQQKERLPYGYGSRGRFISHTETGGMDILIPSWGAMDKSEIDDLAETSIAKEKDRVRKKRNTERKIKQKIGAYMDLALKAPQGQRIKVLKEAMKQEGEA